MKSQSDQDAKQIYFKFLHFWVDQPGFFDLVQETWNTQFKGNIMWRLHQKLKLLSNKLSHWSKNVIGNVYQNVTKWEEKIQAWEEIELISNTEQNREEHNKAQA